MAQTAMVRTMALVMAVAKLAAAVGRAGRVQGRHLRCG